MFYPDLFYALVNKMSPKVIDSLLHAVLAYGRFQKNTVLLIVGKPVYIRTRSKFYLNKSY